MDVCVCVGLILILMLFSTIVITKASNMPKDNIDSAIKRGVEGKAGSNMEAVQVCFILYICIYVCVYIHKSVCIYT